jgi:hypothetical protein
MKYAGLLLAALAGLAMSFLALIFATLQGEQFATIAAISLIVLHLCAAAFALHMAATGRAAIGMAALVSPVFFLYAGAAVVVMAQMALPNLERDPPEFAAACKQAGVEYLARPVAPVHSLAYDFEGRFGPRSGSFRVFNGRVNGRGGTDPATRKLGAIMAFTERRHDPNHESIALAKGQEYVHFPKQGKFYGISELSADAVVFHRRTWMQDPAGDLVLHELTVTDRRDARTLARLRYVLGKHSGRLCGPVQDGMLSEDAFLVQALGLE